MSVAELIQQMAKYRDQHGVIVQANGDGGDSCNRLAHYYAALEILGAPQDDLNRPPYDGFHISLARLTALLPFGRFRRNPDSSKWYNDPDNVTRDQMSPMIAAMALLGTDRTLAAHVKRRLKRCMLHFSTHDQVEGQPGKVKLKLPDLPSPQELASIVRGLSVTWLYWTLPLLDALLLWEVKRCNADRIREGQVLLHLAVALKLQPSNSARKAAELLEKKQEDLTIGLRRYYSEDISRNGIRPLGELMVAVLKAI